VDFQGKYATIAFEENVISAQAVARAMSVTPHMMGGGMQYGGLLILSVPGLKDEAAGKQAQAALGKVEGVARVALYPQQQAVGVEFTARGNVTTKQLLGALEAAGLKGSQYSAGRRGDGRGGQAIDGQNGSARDHANIQMGDGGMTVPGVPGRGRACGCGCCRQQ